MSGKGSKQRPGTGYAQGYDGIDWGRAIPGVSPAPCPQCGEDDCICAPTEDGPGQDEVTREQFIAAYCARSCTTWDELSKYRQAIPCDCGDPSCEGWQMVSGQDEASKEVKTHYERRRFDREGV